MAKRTGDIELAGEIITPAGASSGLAGQDLSLTAGDGNATTGAGGNVLITAGAGVTSGDGGDLTLTPGAGAGAGTGGTINLGGDVDGQGFAITNATFPTATNTQTGTSYTAVLTDAAKVITLDNAAAIAMTIPANASVAYPIGTKLNFEQLGAGTVTIGITTDTLSINAGATLVMNGQYSIATALKLTATSWVLFGQLVPANPPLTSVAVSDLDDGTDGELITWDTAGVATTVPVGTATHVLTSNGVGTVPTFQAPITAAFAENGDNTILSAGAGGSLVAGSNYNFLALDGAGAALTTGDHNILIGENAGSGIITNSDNIIIGNDSGNGTMSNSGRNVVIGVSAFQGVANSTDCIAIGFEAGNALAGGDDCIAIGRGALGGTGSITGGGNIAIGEGAIGFNTSGSMQNNVVIGDGAGGFLQSAASYNVFMGFTAGSGVSTGSHNTFIGRTSGAGFTDGSSSNVCIGTNAGNGVSSVKNNQLVINNVNAADPLISGDFSTKEVHFGGSLRLKERADHIGTFPAATFGELWVRSDTPNVLVFTDDAGTDWDLNTAGGGISNVVEDTSPQLGGALDINGFSIISIDGANPDNIIALAGNATTATNDGGEVIITSGDGNTTGAGGSLQLVSGNGGAGNSTGGPISLTAGTGGGYGGSVTIAAGDAAVDGVGGDIILTPGLETGGNSDGAIVITQTPAPTVTTNKLYNLAGALTWNGTDLTTGGIAAVVDDTTPELGGDLDVNGQDILGGLAGAGGDVNIVGGSTTAGIGGSAYLTGGAASGATSYGGGVYIGGGASSHVATGYGGFVNIVGGEGTYQGGEILITGGEGTGGTGNGKGGGITITGGAGAGVYTGGPVAIVGGDGGSSGGGDILITTGSGATADADGAVVISTGAAGIIESVRGYIATNSTGATALIATIPLTSGDSSVFEVFAVARQDSGTESAAFRIFGAAENTGGTAALIGSTAKDRTDDGGASVDWDVVIGVSSGNLTITLDNDAETVDWKIKVRLTEL